MYRAGLVLLLVSAVCAVETRQAATCFFSAAPEGQFDPRCEPCYTNTILNQGTCGWCYVTGTTTPLSAVACRKGTLPVGEHVSPLWAGALAIRDLNFPHDGPCQGGSQTAIARSIMNAISQSNNPRTCTGLSRQPNGPTTSARSLPDMSGMPDLWSISRPDQYFSSRASRQVSSDTNWASAACQTGCMPASNLPRCGDWEDTLKADNAPRTQGLFQKGATGWEPCSDPLVKIPHEGNVNNLFIAECPPTKSARNGAPAWSAFRVVNSKCKPNVNVEKMKAWLRMYGPVPMSMQACNEFQTYSQELAAGAKPYTGTAGCNGQRNHAVTLVGFTKLNDVDVWIIQNSWGQNSGHGGYYYSRIAENDFNGQVEAFFHAEGDNLPEADNPATWCTSTAGRQESPNTGGFVKIEGAELQELTAAVADYTDCKISGAVGFEQIVAGEGYSFKAQAVCPDKDGNDLPAKTILCDLYDDDSDEGGVLVDWCSGADGVGRGGGAEGSTCAKNCLTGKCGRDFLADKQLEAECRCDRVPGCGKPADATRTLKRDDGRSAGPNRQGSATGPGSPSVLCNDCTSAADCNLVFSAFQCEYGAQVLTFCECAGLSNYSCPTYSAVGCASMRAAAAAARATTAGQGSSKKGLLGLLGLLGIIPIVLCCLICLGLFLCYRRRKSQREATIPSGLYPIPMQQTFAPQPTFANPVVAPPVYFQGPQMYPSPGIAPGFVTACGY